MSGLLSHPEEMKRRMLGEDMSGGLLGTAPPSAGLLTDRTGAFAGLPAAWHRDRQSNNVEDMRGASALQRLMAEFRNLPGILANGAQNVAARLQPPIMSDAEMRSRMQQISRLLPQQGTMEAGPYRMPPIAGIGQ
jgi:hypothetical protein